MKEDRQIKKRISSAQARLHDKLIKLNIKSLGVSEYNQRYLAKKLTNFKGSLQRNARLLYLSLRDIQIPAEDIGLVDYGGGSGTMSYLAAELGVGKIIYNDIYDVSCKDVECISSALGLHLQHIVCICPANDHIARSWRVV